MGGGVIVRGYAVGSVKQTPITGDDHSSKGTAAVVHVPDCKIDGAGKVSLVNKGDDQERADKQTAQSFDQETKLRTEHQSLTKGFDVAQTNYATMPELAADETGGSDIALVNAFFKTFAPDSTVMEGTVRATK